MTRVEIEQNAFEYMLQNGFNRLNDAYIAGAESRNAEIESKDAEIAELTRVLQYIVFKCYSQKKIPRKEVLEVLEKYNIIIN